MDKATLWQGLGNMFTGNLDYARQMESAFQAQKVSAYEASVARDFNAREAEKAREFSREEARINREFQEQMSNSAYQRAVKDLKKAGINPYALGSFSPSSTPSGSTATSYQASGSGGSGYVGSSKSPGGINVLFNLFTGALLTGLGMSVSTLKKPKKIGFV